MWAAQETVARLTEQQAAQATIVRLLESQLEAGVVSRAEVTRERILLEQGGVALREAEQRRAEGRLQLAMAVGLPMAAVEKIQLSFEVFTQPPREVPSVEARRRALLGRADILGALAEYAASEASLQLAIARQYPDVHLSPGYEFDQGDSKWGLGLGLELPVLNRNGGAIAEAEAKRREAAARFNALQSRALGEIESARVAYESARGNLAAMQPLEEQLAEQERLTRSQFEAGAASSRDVAAARLERASAAVLQLGARLKVQQALGDLETALQSPLELPMALLAPLPSQTGEHAR
jgi:outer membrane protein TolC